MAGSSRLALDRVQFVVGAVALLLAILTVGLLIANSSLQRTAAAGQARIASAQAAANVNNALIRMLAKSATENNDPELKALLAANGITVSETKGPAQPAAPAVPAQ